jgi:signal transduction histidine kinase
MSTVGRANATGARSDGHESWRELWLRTAVRGALIVTVYFGLWELAERLVMAPHGLDMHVPHIARGVGATFLLATWSFLQIRRSRLETDAAIAREMSLLGDRVRERTAELAEAQAFTELLLDSLHERIVVVDDDGRVIKQNRVAQAGPGGPLAATDDARAERADDEGRVWELERIPVPGRDAVIEVGRDVTAQRSLEAQVRHQEKMASLGVMAAGFAHDLGNPLASLSTELELLEGEDDVARIRESLAVLRRHVGRMSRTLREMVDFARRRRDEVTDVDIRLVVDDAARLVQHDSRWKKVDLAVDIPHGIPAVRMVEDHLLLVLVNLMINAADAMPDGGTLTVAAREAGGRVTITVRDTGVGMTPAVLAKATTPLFTTKAPGRGTGLGLSVSQSVLGAVGGSLELASEPGRGTVVTIDLPGAEDG